jgi:MOSC domain-containing protein YiiM/ferredoxin-NADP reductase
MPEPDEPPSPLPSPLGPVARLLSVNVGLPRDIEWNHRTVHTGIWKAPVPGRCRVTRLNLEGDGQGDTAGHGGEQRAVFVYQMGSYRYWQAQLHRTDFVFGQFGENFTVEGLADDAVCIGDRYRIGSAVFEVTQPRVTCYRVGIRMNEPRMPALLTSSGRPGFYLRVLQEGDVAAGDDVFQVGEASVRMSVAEINALLYSSNHARDRLASAVQIPALSPGWRSSFEALLQAPAGEKGGGNAGLAPAAASHPVAAGFRPVTIAAIDQECTDVVSVTVQGATDEPLPPRLPGQYIVVRLRPPAAGPPLFRSYSLSGSPSADRWRVSVKLEPNGAAGGYFRDHLRVGAVLDASLPRGTFTLQVEDRPVVLLSAGIGVTPVLAMLYALAEARSTQQILWLYQTRDRAHHPFAAEVQRLLRGLPHARRFVSYSQPCPHDTLDVDFDDRGHLTRATLERVGLDPHSNVYLCGPTRFMQDMRDALAAVGVARTRISAELFTGSESSMPGVVGAVTRLPHVPEHDASTGVLVSFARSGVAARWDPAVYQSLLELAEACDVPVRWSCRSGVCHNCESGLVSGTVAYAPEPLDSAAEGNLLVCCSQPLGDVVIDL